MELLPVDLTAIVAIVMGVSIILIPVAGITARFALKPMVEALSEFFAAKGQEETVRILERRVSFLEQQVESMDQALERLEEVDDFHRRLESGTGDETSPEPDRS